MKPIRYRVSTNRFAILLSALTCLGFAVYSSAAPLEEGSTAASAHARRVTTPLPEAPDDLPAMQATHSQPKPAPPFGGEPLRAEPRRAFLAGPSASVQVNVDASGNNIPGDAANEPTIAVDPANPNRIAIGWRQFNTVTSNFRQAGYAYSADGGQTWTFPGVIQPGQFRSDPVLGSDAAGNFYYSSLSSATAAQVFKSVDGGITWTGPVNSFGGDKQWLAVDDRPSGMGAGHIYQNWNVQFSCCPPNDFTRSIDSAASFQSPIAIPTPSMKWGTLDVGSDGTLFIAGATLNQSGHLVARSSNARDPDITPNFNFVNSVSLGGQTGGFGGAEDPNPGGLLGQVWIAADPSNVNRVYMLASVVPPSGNPIDVKFIRSVDKAVTWSAPVRVNDDPASGAFHWFGTMSVAPNGRIDVIWNDTRHSGTGHISELYYSFSRDTGVTWSPNVPLSPRWDSHVGWPNQSKIGDYYHMVSDNGGANLAYAATFNGEQDVYFLRIPDCGTNAVAGSQNTAAADCNGNSTDDICDIFTDFSQDCNHNLIPDECESAPDCNHNGQSDFCELEAGASDCNLNGTLDTCDIDEGTSDDLNGNQIPDECEGACCLCSGSCSLTTSGGCQMQSGYFLGLGSSCGDVVCGAPNDDCADRTSLPGDPSVSVPFSNVCATLDGPAPINCDAGSQPIGADLWYEYVAPCNGTVRVSLCGTTDFDSILAVYGGVSSVCQCQQIFSAPLVCGDDTCGVGGGPSQVVFSAVAGRCYLIRVAGWNGNIGFGVLQISYDTVCSMLGDIIWNTDPESSDRTTRSLRFSVQSVATGEVEARSALRRTAVPHDGIATATQGQLAIKVTMVDLQHPDPRNLPEYPPPNFSTFDTSTHGTCSGATTTPNFNGHHCSSNADCLGPDNGIAMDDGTCLLPGPGCTAIGETNPPTANGIGGCARWVGMPGTFYESQGPPQSRPYRASRLQCTPVYWNWELEPGGLVTVVGAEILPSSEYSVQAYAASCKGNENTCTNVSASVTMFTRRKGDLDSPYQSPSPAALTQADVLDISQAVAGVKHVLGAPLHSRVQMQPNLPELNTDANVLDIVEAVDSVKRIPYSFSGPCVCPSSVTCGGSCTGCAGLCLKTCVGGDNDGELCVNNTHCPGVCVGGPTPGAVCPSGVPGGVHCGIGGACSGACSSVGTCYDKCGRCSP